MLKKTVYCLFFINSFLFGIADATKPAKQSTQKKHDVKELSQIYCAIIIGFDGKKQEFFGTKRACLQLLKKQSQK